MTQHAYGRRNVKAAETNCYLRDGVAKVTTISNSIEVCLVTRMLSTLIKALCLLQE
jgi:hypothetical protein